MGVRVIRCPECNSKFTFKEKFIESNIYNNKLTCSNCKNIFVKSSKLKILDTIIVLSLEIGTIFVLFPMMDSMNYNIYLSVIVSILSGQFLGEVYSYLIQNFRTYKKYIE